MSISLGSLAGARRFWGRSGAAGSRGGSFVLTGAVESLSVFSREADDAAVRDETHHLLLRQVLELHALFYPSCGGSRVPENLVPCRPPLLPSR